MIMGFFFILNIIAPIVLGSINILLLKKNTDETFSRSQTWTSRYTKGMKIDVYTIDELLIES